MSDFYITLFNMFKVLTFGVTFIVIVFNALALFKLYKYLTRFEFFAFAFFIFLLLFNPIFSGYYSIQTVKYLAYTLTFALGYIVGKRTEQNFTFEGSRKFLIAFAVIPIILYVFNIIVLDGKGHNAFFGRNGLSGYYFSVYFYYIVFFTDTAKLTNNRVYAIIGAMLIFTITTSTIGALLSFMAMTGFFIVYNRYVKFNWKLVVPIIMLSMVLIGFRNQIPIFKRVESMYNDAAVPLMNYKLSDLQYLNFVDFVDSESEEESETSLIFRLKHWANIISVHSEADITEKLLGSGVDYVHTDMPLFLPKYPHNDHLRILVENGVIVLIMLFMVYGKAVFMSLNRVELIPLASLIIFDGSENLLNNFLGMYIFFFTLGFHLKNPNLRNKKTQKSLPESLPDTTSAQGEPFKRP